MSWNRTRYDQCAYRKGLSQSTSPIYYMLDPNKFYNCHDCRPDLGIVAGNNVSVTRHNMVDLESDLFGITRQQSRCPERKYIPHCNQCDEISGIPCGINGCPRARALQALPECKLIHYGSRIDHVGYKIQYPKCTNQTSGYPPQMNPTQLYVKSDY